MGYANDGVVQTRKTKTQSRPAILRQDRNVGGASWLPACGAKMCCTKSSNMIAGTWTRKKLGVPVFDHGMPAAMSATPWKIIEKVKVKNMIPYRRVSEPRCHLNTFSARNAAGSWMRSLTIKCQK